MPQRTEGTETGGDHVRLPAGVVLKPPVSVEDLKTDIERDPERTNKLMDPTVLPHCSLSDSFIQFFATLPIAATITMFSVCCYIQ